MSNTYVKKYDVGQIKLDLPYANYIHELPLLSFGDIQHTVNLSLIFNSERKKNEDNSFYIAEGFKLNLQKRIVFDQCASVPMGFIDGNGKHISLIYNNGVYTFEDDSMRLLRKEERTFVPLAIVPPGGIFPTPVTERYFVIEYPDYSKEEYNTDGYIVATYDKYGEQFLAYHYTDEGLKEIEYVNTAKKIVLNYTNNSLASIKYTYADNVVYTINLNFSDNAVTINNISSDMFYTIGLSENLYRVYSADSNNSSVPVYEKIYESSNDGSTITITDKVNDEIINSTTYCSEDWKENSDTQYNQVEITNHYGEKTRYQYNYNDELLYSYEVLDSDVSFSGDRFQGPITVYKTDNEFNNSGIGIQKQEDGIPLISSGNNRWSADSEMDENTEGYYILTGWFHRKNATSNYSINIQNTDSSFVIPKLSPGQWRYFAYKFYHGYATIMVNLDGNDGNLDLMDLKLSFQKTRELNKDHSYQTLLEEEVLIHKVSGEIIPIKQDTLSHSGYDNSQNWIYIQDLIKYKTNQKKGVNTGEIYYNNGKNIITNTTDLFVNYGDSQVSISNFDLGKRYFENSREHLTKIIIDENTSYLISTEYCIDGFCLQYQEYDDHFDLIESTVEGVTTTYERDCGLITWKNLDGIYSCNIDYADDCITVVEYDLESNAILSTTKYYLDNIWGGVYKLEMLDADGNVVSVINDVYSADMVALMSRKFGNLTNGRSNDIEYLNGNISSLSTGTFNYTFDYSEGKLTSVSQNGSTIEQHNHTLNTIDTHYPNTEQPIHSTSTTFDIYGRLVSIDDTSGNQSISMLTNEYNTNQYYYYIVDSKSYRYFNNYNKSTHGDLLLGWEGNNGAGGKLASTNDHIRNETTRYGYYKDQLTAAVTTENDNNNTILRQETFSYDDDNRLIGDEFYYDYQSSKRVNSDINYDNVTTEAPLKSNRVLSYSYKTNGIEKAKTENTYDTHKRVRQKNYTIGENVFTKEFGYSSTRPTSITESSGGTTIYKYDSMGRITSIDNGEEITYEYDDYGQLGKETNNVLDKTIEYVYNEIGNIDSVTTYNHANGEPSETGTTVTFNYDESHPDRLTSYNGKTIGYNSTGCPISYDGKNLDWTRGKLAGISYVDLSAGENSYDYTYNALGQRVEKSFAYINTSRIQPLPPGGFGESQIAYTTGKNTKFYYDHSGRLIAEYCVENLSDFTETSYRLEYLYDESGMIGLSYTTNNVYRGTYYFQRNLQGDVVGIYDTNGTRVVEYRYDAFGNCSVASTTTNYEIALTNPIRYRGYYFDQETGWYFLNARYYSPEWRRFISPDDAAYIDPETPNGLHLYCYCNNDPVNFVDPSGHSPEWLQGLVIGLAAVGAILVAGAITALTMGVGTTIMATTMVGAALHGAAVGTLIGSGVGILAGAIVGGMLTDWSVEGILTGVGIGFGALAFMGALVGGATGIIQYANAVKSWGQVVSEGKIITSKENMIRHFNKHVVKEGHTYLGNNVIKYTKNANKFKSTISTFKTLESGSLSARGVFLGNKVRVIIDPLSKLLLSFC